MIRWEAIDLEFLSDAELLVEYRASETEAGDPRYNELGAEIDKRGLVVQND